MIRALVFGTFFDEVWEAASSPVALVIYFLLLFLSVGGMIGTVLYMINREKRSGTNGSGALKREEEDEEITSRFRSLTMLDRAA